MRIEKGKSGKIISFAKHIEIMLLSASDQCCLQRDK